MASVDEITRMKGFDMTGWEVEVGGSTVRALFGAMGSEPVLRVGMGRGALALTFWRRTSIFSVHASSRSKIC